MKLADGCVLLKQLVFALTAVTLTVVSVWVFQ